MRSVFVLPLYPLEDIVLLPGERCGLASSSEQLRAIVERAHDFGGAVVASLADGESVHEVGVTAIVSGEPGSEASLYGVSRCRLLSLVSEDVPMVRAERFPEAPAEEQRQATVARLLHTSYQRLLLRVGCEPVSISPQDLTALTWRVTAYLGLPAEQQQGFLNVPDPLTRGRLLLVALRDLERRERFLQPWAHLRTTTPWN
jgi:Lon protease-like protein